MRAASIDNVIAIARNLSPSGGLAKRNGMADMSRLLVRPARKRRPKKGSEPPETAIPMAECALLSRKMLNGALFPSE